MSDRGSRAPADRPASAGGVPSGARTAERRPGLLATALSCLRIALVSGTLVLVLGLLVVTGVFVGTLYLFRSIDPPGSLLMLAHRIDSKPVTRQWAPLTAISPTLVRAVISSEDGQFCRHRGVDFKELAAVMDKADRGEDVRGASTISMQVTKNMFLWPDRSYVRKALEIGMALVMEQIWSKPRIMEIYLNVAEWGPGIFGAEAAARYHFGKSAASLTEREAALLATALPNPLERTPRRPSAQHVRLSSVVERRMRGFGQRGSCLPGL